MIEGFEDITYELSEQEKALIPLFVKGLKNKYGIGNAITSGHIITELKKKNIIVTGPRIRKIINYIRNSWLVPGLIATSKGYYISVYPEEVKTYISSLGHRESAIASIRKRMEEYLKQLEKK